MDAPPALDALPPSARQVFATLSTQGPLTHRDLVAATGMPARTVRYAVGRLREAGVIDARCNLMDCRQCYFFVTGACPGKTSDGRIPVAFAGIRAT